MKWFSLLRFCLTSIRAQDSTTIKKRRLDPNRQAEFDEAVYEAKQHLDRMEALIDTEKQTESLEKRHQEHKSILDQVLNTGHALVDELEEGKQT